MFEKLPWWMQVFLLTCLAILAAWVAYLQQFANPEKRPKWDWLTFFIKGLTAGFVGLLTQLLLYKAGADSTFSAFAVAIAGWSGAETVVIFQEAFRGAISKYAGNAGPKG